MPPNVLILGMRLTRHFAHRQWGMMQRYGGQRFAFAHPTWLWY